MVLLQAHPLPESAEIVAEVEGVRRRLDPGQDPRSRGRGRGGVGHAGIVSGRLYRSCLPGLVHADFRRLLVRTELCRRLSGILRWLASGDGRRRSAHQHPGHPTSVHLAYDDPVAVELDGVTGLGQSAELRHDVTADRLVGAFGELESRLVLEVVEIEQSVHLNLTATVPGGLGLDDVVLVLDAVSY